MKGFRKKEQIAEFLASTMDHKFYEKANLDVFITAHIKSEIIRVPMYAADHLRRALIEFGFMTRNPYTDVYTLAESFVSFPDKHQLIQKKLLVLVEKSPHEKIRCDYCDYLSKPVAMLNHYLKKHSFEKYFENLKRECAPEYLRGF